MFVGLDSTERTAAFYYLLVDYLAYLYVGNAKL